MDVVGGVEEPDSIITSRSSVAVHRAPVVRPKTPDLFWVDLGLFHKAIDHGTADAQNFCCLGYIAMGVSQSCQQGRQVRFGWELAV